MLLTISQAEKGAFKIIISRMDDAPPDIHTHLTKTSSNIDSTDTRIVYTVPNKWDVAEIITKYL